MRSFEGCRLGGESTLLSDVKKDTGSYEKNICDSGSQVQRQWLEDRKDI